MQTLAEAKSFFHLNLHLDLKLLDMQYVPYHAVVLLGAYRYLMGRLSLHVFYL
jgi:hypothetical protein